MLVVIYLKLSNMRSILSFTLLYPRMTIAAFSSLCLVKLFHFHELPLLVTSNYHLGNPLTIVNSEVFS